MLQNDKFLWKNVLNPMPPNTNSLNMGFPLHGLNENSFWRQSNPLFNQEFSLLREMLHLFLVATDWVGNCETNFALHLARKDHHAVFHHWRKRAMGRKMGTEMVPKPTKRRRTKGLGEERGRTPPFANSKRQRATWLPTSCRSQVCWNNEKI